MSKTPPPPASTLRKILKRIGFIALLAFASFVVFLLALIFDL